jgi:hypothetical protein
LKASLRFYLLPGFSSFFGAMFNSSLLVLSNYIMHFLDYGIPPQSCLHFGLTGGEKIKSEKNNDCPEFHPRDFCPCGDKGFNV